MRHVYAWWDVSSDPICACFQLIDKTRIVIVPSLNPDGREIAQERDCTSKIGQTNSHGKDLDTDFTSKAIFNFIPYPFLLIRAWEAHFLKAIVLLPFFTNCLCAS